MVCLQFVIVVFPDHTHLLFLNEKKYRLFLHFSEVRLLVSARQHYGAFTALYLSVLDDLRQTLWLCYKFKLH